MTILTFLAVLPLTMMTATAQERNITGGKHTMKPGTPQVAAPATIKVVSPSFDNDTMIPARFTCDGQGVNPELALAHVPPQAKSLVLMVEDPDAADGTFLHWLVYDMPVVSRIEEDSIQGKQGMNSAGKKNYHGPCPPSGTHHYHFRIYAIDRMLDLPEGVSRDVVDNAMKGHVMAEGDLVGLYQRENR